MERRRRGRLAWHAFFPSCTAIGRQAAAGLTITYLPEEEGKEEAGGMRNCSSPNISHHLAWKWSDMPCLCPCCLSYLIYPET